MDWSDVAEDVFKPVFFRRRHYVQPIPIWYQNRYPICFLSSVSLTCCASPRVSPPSSLPTRRPIPRRRRSLSSNRLPARRSRPCDGRTARPPRSRSAGRTLARWRRVTEKAHKHKDRCVRIDYCGDWKLIWKTVQRVTPLFISSPSKSALVEIELLAAGQRETKRKAQRIWKPSVPTVA